MKKYLISLYMEMEKSMSTIKETYNVLNTSNEIKLQLHSAGEWILDNMYIINQEYVVLKEEFENITIKKIPYIQDKNGVEKPRIQAIAKEMIEKHHGVIDQYILSDFMREYQKTTYVTFSEVVLLPFMLRVELINFIGTICEHIYYSQYQKIKVEKLLEKVLESKKKINLDKYIENLKEDLCDVTKIRTTNTAYVEYLAYRIKMLGVKGDKLYDTLKEEACKAGFTIEEAIEKQHNEITKTKLYVGNAIVSIKKMSSTNWVRVFETINKIDEVLNKDYAKIYKKMDYKTKDVYRRKVISLAEKSKYSEMYVAKKAVDCSFKYKKHVGLFLLDDDYKKYLYNEILPRHKYELTLKKALKKVAPICYMIAILLITAMFTVAFANSISEFNTVVKVALDIAFFFLAFEMGEKIVNYLLHKIIRPRTMPRISYEINDIEKENAVMVAMPTVVSSKEKIDEMVEKMETTYLANKTENIYFVLLGDCIGAKTKEIPLDKELFNYGREKVIKLNEKYDCLENPKFNFIYRKRVYSKGEGEYMGYERKRGALNQLNKLLLNKLSNKDIDNIMYIAFRNIPKVKYCLTIDEDTVLPMGSAKELVGIMAHPLNKPYISKKKNIVTKGYGLIQPQVGLDIEAANVSVFSKLFGGFGGIDIYTNSVSNVYQDCFYEAIFTGKGIYDIEVFEKVLDNEIPENLVLSHDLLEGSYLKTGLASDVEVQDGFPSNFISYTKRAHRWTRGDVQILSWLKPSSKLNLLSKWKILDNLRRSTLDIFVMIYLIIAAFMPARIFTTSVLLTFIAVNYGMIFSMVDALIYGKDKQLKQKQYMPLLYGFKADIVKMLFNYITVPYRAYMNLNAICLSLYRMFVSHKKLLEWKTAATLDKFAKNTVKSFYAEMWPTIITAMVFIVSMLNKENLILKAVVTGLLLISPYIAYLFSTKSKVEKLKKLNKEEEKEVKEIAERTWKFFDNVMTETYNYLPTDNYQDNRRPKMVPRTSSTNIGFGLQAIINAYDLKFIGLEDCLDRLEKVLLTIEKLPKWYGHLYNWYNTKTLNIEGQKFVSTVDSGNFVTILFVVKSFLMEINNEKSNELLLKVQNLIDNTDFTKLFDKESNQFSIGFDLQNGCLARNNYDMLASECRQTSLVSIALGQVPYKHWFALSRNLVTVDDYKGLASWSGTAFEYFMPTLYMKSYNYTLLDEALHFVLRSQLKYAKINNIPWGISESAYANQDVDLNYQYKAFGIPWLGYKRGLNTELVVSPYSTFLMMYLNPKEAVQNLNRLKDLGAYSTFGFYESIDFTKKHIKANKKYEVVKTYMSHHQGMAFTAMANLLTNNINQERFHRNAEIKSAEILLKERTPVKVAIRENIKAKDNTFVQKELSKYTSFVGHISKVDLDKPKVNLITNGRLSEICLDNGSSYITYKGKSINKGLYTNVEEAGNFITFKDKQTKIKWSSGYAKGLNEPDKYFVNYSLDNVKITRVDGDIETVTTKTISTDSDTEINKISLLNNSDTEKEIIVNTYCELVLTDYLANVVHPAFNNLKIETAYDKDLDILIAKRRNNNASEDKLYAYTKFVGLNASEEVDYETEKIRIVENDKPYSEDVARYPLWPVVSMRTVIKLKPYEKREFYYILGVTDNRYDISHMAVLLDKEAAEEKIKLASEKANIVSRYLRLEPHEAMQYNSIVSKLLFSKKEIQDVDKYWNNSYSQSMLWKYGISGDIPILKVEIKSIEEAVIIKDIIKFMDYIKQKKVDVDIVIFISVPGKDKRKEDSIRNYLEQMQSNVTYLSYTRGKIYTICSDDLDEKEKELFDLVSKFEIESKYASLEGIAKTTFEE